MTRAKGRSGNSRCSHDYILLRTVQRGKTTYLFYECIKCSYPKMEVREER